VQLSDDAGASWREISALAPHGADLDGWSGWVDDVEIDPNNPERILHVHGGGVWETRNASAAKPSWTNSAASGIEETATLALMTPPPGASYSLLNSSGDIGMVVDTDLATAPVRGPKGWFGNSNSADMAWSNSAYIATIGTTTWNHPNVGGAYSTDAGLSWTAFPANHPDGLAHQGGDSTLAVTKPGYIVWAPSASVPAYTTNHGANWTYTNLPAVTDGRSYRLAADRKNPNRMYAYESGGGWWGPAPQFYSSTDGGHTFTVSSQFSAAGARPEFVSNTSLAVNPNAEGDVWVADAHSVFHSPDGGATWTKLSATGSIWGSHPITQWPEVYGATAIALGKAPAGASYSASVYVVGVINGVWGVYRSDDGGTTWRRFNDDKHQYGGIGVLAADQTVPGRLYMAGSGRGILFSY
jgi:xyloglucan-specific exo-beta-1,4-glucanase